jgi:aspartate 1-decarboxylase
MFRKFLVGKIHRATVTGADVNYVGSITVDPLLIEEAGILPLEEVDIWDVTNGERISTYCLPGARGSGQVTINGAAARKVQAGDKVIVSAFAWREANDRSPQVVRSVVPDEQNRVVRVFSYRSDLGSGEFATREETPGDRKNV